MSVSQHPTSLVATETFFCNGCGHPCDSSHRFCNFCGRAVSSASVASAAPSESSSPTLPRADVTSAAIQHLDQIANVAPAADVRTLQSNIAQVQAASVSTPTYANFVIVSIGGAVAASITSFSLADGAARGQWNSVSLTVIATVLCLLFLNAAVKSSRRLQAIGAADADILIRRKKLLRRSIFFAALFIVTAAVVGNGIGTSGAETKGLLGDIDKMSRLGDQISKARNAAERTVPAQVEMYKSIDANVEQLSAVLARLREEYATYDRKYPSQHEIIAKSLQGVGTGAKRMDLLRQQIAVAKVIDGLDDADAQFRIWKARMQPLLDRENELDSSK